MSAGTSAGVADLVAAIDRAEGDIDVDGRHVRLTTLDRVLWPQAGYTKRDMLRYLVRAAPALLPHLRRRPVTLARFPEGVDGPAWYQANCRGRPDWVRVARVEGRRGATFEYCLVEDLATLLWLGNLGTIELHPFAWTVDRPGEPTALVLDLDPGAPAGIAECAVVALHLRDALARHHLVAFAKTSGALGLHVVVPLAPGQTFDAAKAFARALATGLQSARPDLVVARMARAERPGKVFVDWVQNVGTRSTIAPWSLRAMPLPSVSTPLTWAEVETAAGCGGEPMFGPEEALQRYAAHGDAMGPALDHGRRLPTAD